ncbi:hypothetical protein [uncultured Bacteroides sp.]|uniref:hypothetical protein n=1 Tax=uncultured Bacteroides sp. TaxID=162156 RepID=UPI0025DFD314|nr:hypothetical protein [uncultured Bacteroides sp.]
MEKQQPLYDIFISFKRTEVDGRDTEDYQIAKELFNYLDKKGLRVFFSDESFKKLGTAEYKFKIDRVLDVAKILIVVGTSREHMDSNWVRYEWDSFCGDILDGIKKDGKLYSYIDHIGPADLPRTLRKYQSFEKRNTSLSQIYQYICSALGKSADFKEVLHSSSDKYSIYDYNDIKKRHWDFEKTVQKLMSIVYETLDPESAESILDAEASVKIMERSCDTWRILVGPNEEIIGHWFFVSLYDQEYEKLLKGELLEEDISYKNINYLDLPGDYKGYFAQIDIMKEYRNARTLQRLIISFLEQLVVLAKQGIFFTDWCADSLSPEGSSLSHSMGLSYVSDNLDNGKIYVGKTEEILASPIFKRVPDLIKLYKNEWKRRGKKG